VTVMSNRIVLLAASLAGCWPGWAMADDMAAYVRARAAEGDKKVDLAARQYAIALAAAPDNAGIAQRAWREAILAGDLDLARRSAAALTASGRPLPAEAPILTLADALHAHDAKATDAAMTALEKSPFRFIAPIVRAWLALDAGGDVLRPLAGEHPKGSERLIDENRAMLLIAKGNSGDAAKALETLLSGSSGGLDLRYNAAELLAGRGQIETARALVRGDDPAVAYFRDHFRPARASAAYGISRLLSRIASELTDGRVTSIAIAYCRAALLIDPGNDRARLLLGQALARFGAYDRALATLDEIGPDSPFRLMARTARVDTLGASGDDAGALTAARLLAEAPGASDDEARLYGNILMDADRPADAATAYATARDRMGEAADWTAWLQLGMAQDKAGKWSQARSSLERAVELAPRQPLALNYLGYALTERGEDLDQAQALLEKASTLAPGEPSITDSLGWVYFRRGDEARALPLLEQAAQASPANGEISDHLGDAYWAKGRFYEARYAWRAALVVADETDDRARIEAKLLNGPEPRR